MTVNLRGTNVAVTVDQPTTFTRTRQGSSSGESLCMTLIETVEDATGTDALDLPPMHDAVDADALDALVRSADRSLTLTFEYAGLEVAINGDGDISLTSPGEQ